ncbi:Ferrisiderophore receptor-like protein [Alloalcanivorax dieselolei B5]|uniref:Ferrisiderophore receptor-like protein n=1 Tax=Alcanivorax dieselolei (strain DSM 16502 / CGMCC 1.3690 / MCCC 1A00001 / B-5) TaxID=930169 RepID=K0CI71_ALCDB|nr:Ferrisiderophore receptor-like protein [Alloalcanivorax dieselolei B5]
MGKKIMRLSIAVAMVLIGVASSASFQARAEPLAPQPSYFFDIPAMDLGQAIKRYSEDTGLTVLVDAALVRNRRSFPVIGDYTPKEALQRLLGPHELEVRYQAEKALTLVPYRRSEGMPGRTGSGAGLSQPGLGGHRVAAAIQERLHRRLCSNRLTRPGHYRAAMRLWTDQRGDVSKVELLDSSGDGERDHALRSVIRGIHVEPGLAAKLPQPLTVLVVPSTGTPCPNEAEPSAAIGRE